MNRRSFLKYFFILAGAGCAAGAVVFDFTGACAKSSLIPARIKEYKGRIRPMGDEIGAEGKWNG